LTTHLVMGVMQQSGQRMYKERISKKTLWISRS
jgi:hypothetical protein